MCRYVRPDHGQGVVLARGPAKRGRGHSVATTNSKLPAGRDGGSVPLTQSSAPKPVPLTESVEFYIGDEQRVGRMLDYAVIVPRLQRLYEWSAQQLTEPRLLELVRDGNPIYAWPFEQRHVWRSRNLPFAARVLAGGFRRRWRRTRGIRPRGARGPRRPAIRRRAGCRGAGRGRRASGTAARRTSRRVRTGRGDGTSRSG